jgi:type IV secretion system protein VirB10
MADKERKQAWLDYYAQLAALRKQRYQTAMSAIKSTDSTVFGGRLDAASTTTSAPPAARPMNAPIIPGQPFVPGYGGGFPGGFGEFGPGEEGAGQREKIAFVNQTGNLGQNDVLRQPRRQPPSPFALMAGSYIPSLAETAVNSDAPGAFIGRVTQDVHDTAHGACVIIPQGSKIIGRYDSQTTMGQERLPGVLTRIIYPDATSLDLGAMEAADQGGAAGFDAEVDRHFLQRLGNGLVIGIAGAASQLVNALPFGSAVYSGPHAAINTAAQLGLSIPPTLTVLPGTRFNVITGKDITIRPWSCNGQPPRPLLPIMTAN